MFLQLLPSPKWKLVVDIGEPEESPAVSAAASTTAPDTITAGISEGNESFATSTNTQINGKDPRMEDVVSLLGEYMPSDPSSTMAPYLSGFMSLRLLFLRPSRTPEEAELARTMLDSYSSYSAGGRSRSDIAVMLARDFMFLSQQQQQVQVAHASHHNGFLGLGGQQHQMNAHPPAPSGMSLFGLPSTTTSFQNSPALTPIPMPGTTDSMSIVSN